MDDIAKTDTRSDLAPYLFHQGTNYRAYDYLGVHVNHTEDGMREYVFRTFAPRAFRVDVTGDFNDWSGSYHMRRVTDGGVYEYRIKTDRSFEGMHYKFYIEGHNGAHLKADPYAHFGETGMSTASIVHAEGEYRFGDGVWMKQRKKILGNAKTGYCPIPMNIYEMHLGSWRTRDSRSTAMGDAYLSYREIVEDLVPYCKQMGYTHVELLPVMEHPFDGSWGYQVGSYYAPTSRFGTPEDFKYFVDRLHQNGIGVILDWVPAHFPKDEHGLFEFDGSPLYEYQGKDRQEHKGWGTRFFDLGRNEVQCFLISNALFWMREYHIDGIRCDAVAAMLYLDFDREPGEWSPNEDGSNNNRQAEAFLRKLNSAVGEEFPDALMIAEESSDYEKLTHPTSVGGMGFSFKWNMGWANDLYDYIGSDGIYRQYKHDKLTFPLMYAFRENYILPISHDEVVHGKKSLLDKMWGDYDQKFASLRAFCVYMMTTPGKKLWFMGTEYAPFREWDYENSLEWFMLKYPVHDCHHRFTAKLNHFYLSHGALWERDFSWEGFEWLLVDRAQDNVIAYLRYGRAGRSLLTVVNFSPNERLHYPVPTPAAERLCEVFNTDALEFGGSGTVNEGELETVKEPWGDVLYLDLAPLSATVLEPIDTWKKKPRRKASDQKLAKPYGKTTKKTEQKGSKGE